MSEILIRKDGSQSIANESGVGIDSRAVDAIVEEHRKLREDGFHTGQVSSGAVLEGRADALAAGLNPAMFSRKVLAMAGLSGHFGKWKMSARHHGLLAVSSLSTSIELRDSKEGRQIRGGMGEALANEDVLLVANYHDEADPTEMNEYEKMLSAQGRLLRTESEENDFHAAHIAVGVGAGTLMLCTRAEGFIYKGRKLDEINVEDIEKYLKYIDETQTDNRNGLSTGGMGTKLRAARAAIIPTLKRSRAMKVVIGDSSQDSRRILEDNAGTWVVQ